MPRPPKVHEAFDHIFAACGRRLMEVLRWSPNPEHITCKACIKERA